MDETGSADKPKISATGLAADLAQRDEDGNPIRVCIIGAGEMGTDLVTAIRQMRGVEIASIVDRSLQKAVPALQIAGYEDDRGVVCETHASITQGLENNKIPIVPDAHEALSHDRVDVVIDATGGAGGRGRAGDGNPGRWQASGDDEC